MEKIVIWGTGSVAKQVLAECMTLNQYNIIAAVDNDKSKHGSYFNNIIVVSPEYIISCKCEYDQIVILADAYEDICNQILGMDASLEKRINNKNYFYKKSIIKRYKNCRDHDISEIIEYLKNNELEVFNYEFIKGYSNISPQVYKDNMCGLFYVIHNGKKMYFSRIYDDEKKVIDYYRYICMEQDENSPHKYLSKDFNVELDSVVVDVGVAEGNFSLDIIDRVKRIYMIEANPLWIEALKYTFRDYMDKIVLIPKFASSYDEGDYIRLDTVIQDKIDFLKMDIEGFEYDALQGGKQLINKSDKIRLAICAYHNEYDQDLIEGYMDKLNIKHTTSPGFLWIPCSSRNVGVSTKLNRAIVRGIGTCKGEL